MLKKLGAIVSLFIICFSLSATSVQPVFKNYADSFEVYLESASSLAQIERVKKQDYYFLRGVKGESVCLESENFSLEKLLLDFDAQIKFTERTCDSEIFYAYSPQIKYLKTVGGEKVNLQIAVAKDRVVLGSPLIFGSF